MTNNLPVFLQKNQTAISWVVMLALVVYGLNYQAAKTLTHLAGVMSLIYLSGLMLTGNLSTLKSISRIRWLLSGSLLLSALIVWLYTKDNATSMAYRFNHDFILQALIFSLICMSSGFTKQQQKFSLYALIAALLTMGLHGLIQSFNHPTGYRVSGSLDLPIIYAMNISVISGGLMGLLIVFIKENTRLLLVTLFITFFLSVAAVLASGSRTPLLALAIVAIPALLVTSYRVMGLRLSLIIITICILAAGPVLLKSQTYARSVSGIENLMKNNPASSVGMRLQMWNAARSALTEHPLEGVGVGQHNDYFAEKLKEDPDFIHEASRHFIHLHNDWLNAMVWMGIPAGILFMLFALLPAVWGGANLKKAKLALPVLMASTAYLLNGLTNAPSIRAPSIILLLLVLVLLLTQQEAEASSSAKSK